MSLDKDPLPPSFEITPMTYADLRRGGFIPIILAMHTRGLNEVDIATQLSEDFNVRVDRRSVRAALDRFGGGDNLVVASAQQEYAELHQIALEQLNSMRTEYEALKGKPASKEINNRLEMLQRYFIQWWDRVGKFHFRADNVSLTANITQVSMIDALAQVKGKPKDAVAVLAKLRGEDAAPGDGAGGV